MTKQFIEEKKLLNHQLNITYVKELQWIQTEHGIQT